MMTQATSVLRNARTQLRGKPVLGGVFIVSASPLVAEACCMMPLDFLALDLEASPAGRAGLTQMLQAIARSPALALARTATQAAHDIEAALDAGADGVIVPKVSTVEEAEAVVRAAKYPPSGERGLNPIRCSGYFTDIAGYLQRANEELIVAIQIETLRGVVNVDAIARVEGIDMLFVGCGDLAASLGHIGNVEHPDVEAAILKILSACNAAGIVPGIFAYSPALATRYRSLGYRFVALGNDIKLMLQSIDQTLQAFRDAI